MRLSYHKDGENIKIVDSNDYYPFGLSFIRNAEEEAYFGTASFKNYKYQGQELQETGFYSFKWRDYMPDVGRFFNIDPLTSKYPYNSPYAFQENKLGMGVELEGLELLKNHTGFFAIYGNAMKVKRAPISQTDGRGHATFTAGDIGLTTSGYNPGARRMSDGSTGLRLNSYKYNGSTPDEAKMENVKDKPENSDRQKFTTTKRGLGMTNKLMKSYEKLDGMAGGLQELVNLIGLIRDIPKAIKSTDEYTQASKDVKAIEGQAMRMDDAIKYVDSSGIDMNQQTRNDVVNYVFDGTLPNPDAGLMPNSLIIQYGTQIMKTNGIPIQPLDQQLINRKIKP